MSAKALKFKKSAEPHPDPLKSLLHRIQKAYLPKDYLVFVGHIETLAQSDVGRRVQAEWQQAQASLQGNKQAALSNEILYRREGGKERDLLKRVSVIDNPLVFLLLLQNEQRRRRLAEYETKLRPEAGGRFIALLLNAMMKQDPIERLDLERQAQEGRMSEENECRRAKEQRKEAETKQRVEEHARRSYRGVLQTELPDPRPHLWSEPMTVTDYVESTGMGEDKVKAFLRTNKCQAIECSARNKRRRYGMETNFKVLNQWLCNWARHKRRPHPWDKRQRISREELDRRTHDVRLSWLAVTIHHCMTYACDRMGELLFRLEPSFSLLCSTEAAEEVLLAKIAKLLKLSRPVVSKPELNGLFLPDSAV